MSKVVDNSNPKKAKNVQLQYPLRIKVQKSPVLVHFDMHKVAVSCGGTGSVHAYIQLMYLNSRLLVTVPMKG